MTPVNSEKQQEKRQRIMQAAMEVFAGEGFAAAKVSEIARRAGVGKGTVYEYFSGKQQLLEEVSIVFLDQMTEMIKPFAALDDPRRALRDLVKQTVSFAEQMKPLMPVVIDFWAAGLKKPGSIVGRQMAKGMRAMMDCLDSMVDKGVARGIYRNGCNGRYVGLLLFTMLDEGLLASFWLSGEIDINVYSNTVIQLIEDHLLQVREHDNCL